MPQDKIVINNQKVDLSLTKLFHKIVLNFLRQENVRTVMLDLNNVC